MVKAHKPVVPPVHPAGHRVRVQVVSRAGGDQYTITLPRPLAEFWGLRKGVTLNLSEEPGTKRVIFTKAL